VRSREAEIVQGGFGNSGDTPCQIVQSGEMRHFEAIHAIKID
jgi:hypothetical protein